MILAPTTPAVTSLPMGRQLTRAASALKQGSAIEKRNREVTHAVHSEGQMRSRKGFALVEILVAVAILATIGVAMLAAMSTSSRVLTKTDSYETARDLAVAQMEYVKQSAWNDSAYAKDSSIIPTGYDAAISVETLHTENANATLQKITVIVTRDGSEVTRLQDYRVSPYGFGE